MTKGQIVELIQRGNEPKPDLQVVAKYLDLVFSQVVIPLFAKDASNLDMYAKRFDNIAIAGNKATIPVATIQFPDAANGVRQVYCPDHKNVQFVPEKEGQYGLLDLLEVGHMDQSVGYTPRADTVTFADNLPSYIDTVSMNIVVMPSDLDDDDEFVLPAGFDQQAMIAGFMAKIPPENKMN